MEPFHLRPCDFQELFWPHFQVAPVWRSCAFCQGAFYNCFGRHVRHPSTTEQEDLYEIQLNDLRLSHPFSFVDVHVSDIVTGKELRLIVSELLSRAGLS